MEFIKKYFWVFCATVAILGMAVLAVKICDGNKIPIWVEIEQNDSAEKILAWYDAESSINYFFLPSIFFSSLSVSIYAFSAEERVFT